MHVSVNVCMHVYVKCVSKYVCLSYECVSVSVYAVYVCIFVCIYMYACMYVCSMCVGNSASKGKQFNQNKVLILLVRHIRRFPFSSRKPFIVFVLNSLLALQKQLYYVCIFPVTPDP